MILPLSLDDFAARICTPSGCTNQSGSDDVTLLFHPIELERGLQARLSVISKDQLSAGSALQGAAESLEAAERRQTAYHAHLSTVQSLITHMRSTLQEARTSIQSAVSTIMT